MTEAKESTLAIRFLETHAVKNSKFDLYSGLRRGIGKVIEVLSMLASVNLLLDLVKVDVCYCTLAIKDTSDVLESGSFGLDVEEVHEDELAKVPELERSLSEYW